MNDAPHTSVCPNAGLCGGCFYQDVSYEDQLKEKELEVHRLFEQAEIDPPRFDPIEGCPEGARFAYRNKMEYTFGDLQKDGPLTLGMHRKKSFMSVVTCDACQLVSSDYNQILRATLDFCLEEGYEKYNKKFHRGLLRNLVIRDGKRTGEILVNIVTTSEPGFDEDAWVERLKELPLNGRIIGFLHTVNDGKADAVIADELWVLSGRPWYTEQLLGLGFQVHAFAFFQTNVEAVERLYSEAVGLIDDLPGKTVFDLYCGTGTISQVLARHAGRVIGVELVPESVEAARRNAEMNGLTNCEFRCGDVFQVLSQSEEKPDVIVVDPPRAGIMPDAVGKIASYGVPEIVYISCNPKTLVKNLAEFRQLGYETVYAKPYDNFPNTRHVECVVLMSKANT